MSADPFATVDEAAEAVLSLLRERVADDTSRGGWPGTVKRRRMRDALLLALGQADASLRPLLTAYQRADVAHHCGYRDEDVAAAEDAVCECEQAFGRLAAELLDSIPGRDAA